MDKAELILVPALISLGGVLVSLIAAVFVAGTRWGAVENRLRQLENNSATKTDLNALQLTLAEIKGMFKLTLREDDR